MVSSGIQPILEAAYPKDIIERVVDAAVEIESNFRLEKWKPSELDAGHFVEAVRRIIEHELLGSYTPFNQSIGTFSQAVLNQYESATGLEEYRILIPRVLYSMYCIRNKRGVGHISSIAPNKQDATYILYATKWVLSELVRIAGSSSPDEAHRLTDQIIERQVDRIWDDGETFMILDKELTARQAILLCLYKTDRMPIRELQTKVGYKNATAFKKLVFDLRSNKLLDVTTDSICKLSPLGIREAERILSRRG